MSKIGLYEVGDDWSLPFFRIGKIIECTQSVGAVPLAQDELYNQVSDSTLFEIEMFYSIGKQILSWPGEEFFRDEFAGWNSAREKNLLVGSSISKQSSLFFKIVSTTELVIIFGT